MAFIDKIKIRVSDEELIQLTRQDDHSTAATIDDTVLQAAIDDAVGEFEPYTGFIASDTDSSHVASIVGGTLYYLNLYKNRGGEETRELHIRFERFMNKIRDIRTAPAKSSSALTPSTEVPSGEVIRPDMDRANFQRYLPRSRLGNDRFRHT